MIGQVKLCLALRDLEVFYGVTKAAFIKDPRTIAAFKNDMIIFNMTVWETFEDLKRFVYNQVHTAVMQDRDMWFDKMPSQVSVMWWVKVDERPTIQ
jgi:Domain of unknown function (DUF3291)